VSAASSHQAHQWRTANPRGSGGPAGSGGSHHSAELTSCLMTGNEQTASLGSRWLP
jgi:hypothetical protein